MPPHRDSAAVPMLLRRYTIYFDYDYAIRGGGKNSFLAISSAAGLEKGGGGGSVGIPRESNFRV